EPPFYPPVTVDNPQRRKVSFVSVDEIVKSYARRIAEEKVDDILHSPEAQMNSGNSGWRSIMNNITAPFRHPVRFGQKMWVRMASQGYQYKFYREILDEINNNQNLMQEFETSWRMGRVTRTLDANERRDNHYETLEKIISEYSNGVAEEEERGNDINNIEVNNELNSLLNRYYLENWDRPRFEDEQKRMINGLRERGLISHLDFLGQSGRAQSEVEDGIMYASNLYQIAQEYRSDIETKINQIAGGNELDEEQKKKIEEHICSTIQLDISLGAKWGDLNNRRPQGTFNNLERIVSTMQRTPILGRILSNPGTIAIISSVGLNYIRRGLSKSLLTAGVIGAGIATGPMAIALSAGVLAGVYGYGRRSMELKKDRAMHQRQRSLGKEYGDYRRGRMEEFQYDDIPSTEELMNQLNAIENLGDFDVLPQEQKQDLASMFARFKLELARTREYRVEGGENRTVDLISVPKGEGDEYGTNIISKTDLKIALYNYLRRNNLIETQRSALGGNDEFNNLFNEEVRRLDDNINNADRNFDSFRQRQALMFGAISGISGIILGRASQRIVGKIGEWTGDLSGNHPGNVPLNSPMGNAGNLNNINNPIDNMGVAGATGAVIEKMVPKNFDNSKDFFKALYENYDPNQRISYKGFFHQGSAPDPGIRALPETIQNLAHNLKLHSNSTELMMDYKQDSNGHVIVSAQRMLGKTLKGFSQDQKEEFTALLKAGKIKLALSLDNDPSVNGSQFNPIIIPMREDGQVEIPEKVAKVFFGFDNNGKVLQGAGKHSGLHSLIYDTGLKREKD
ncbi:MAG: hypothetical protein COT31_04150, partial [Candidatus Moranbacteria bacterium CG08_land_8_20_14_0_20_34_16]